MGYFTPELFQFLRQLKRNNNREWFNKNKARYLDEVQGPALEFVASVGPGLAKISPTFVADPRPVGGSLFRIYRDTRFSNDKRRDATFGTCVPTEARCPPISRVPNRKIS